MSDFKQTVLTSAAKANYFALLKNIKRVIYSSFLDIISNEENFANYHLFILGHGHIESKCINTFFMTNKVALTLVWSLTSMGSELTS